MPFILCGTLILPFVQYNSVVFVNIQANLRKRYVGKRREQRGNSTLEGAGTPRWVGIGFNPIPKPTPHHLSRSIPFKGEQIQLPFA